MAGYYNKKCGGITPASIPLAVSKPLLCSILASFICAPGWAQSQASDVDNWVQFPPRPRPLQAQQQTGQVSAPKTAPPTSAVVSTTKERDNWLRFPIRPTAPVAIEPSLTKQTDVSVPTPTSSELQKAAALEVTPKRNEVVPSTANRLAGFKITGNQRLTESAILSELRTLVGAPLTQENLQKATEKVTALYQKNGYLAVAEMPAQDLTSGWAQVKVVEATFAGTVMQDPLGLDFPCSLDSRPTPSPGHAEINCLFHNVIYKNLLAC